MNQIQLEKLAARNGPMPEGLNGAEQILYQGLCLLHKRYGAGQIDTAAAHREKIEMLQAYGRAEQDLRAYEKGRVKWDELSRLVQDYRQSPTLGKANKIIEFVYGCKFDWKGQNS